MPINIRDCAHTIEAECYAIRRLEERAKEFDAKNGGGKPTIYAGQVEPIRIRLWRVHVLLEELADLLEAIVRPAAKDLFPDDEMPL